ncbi:transglutaminase family protein [Microbacterium sp. 22242]|uniref:transglutaminase family protein n=1 Tax=Microbacterium sp. 22242 TaxID=3453896 RepID=UPI003F82D275
MPASDLSAYGGPRWERTPFAGPAAAAALIALGMLVVVWPLAAVVQPGAWSAGAAVTAGSVILTGLVARILTRRSAAWLALPVVPIAQLIVGAVALAVFASKQVTTIAPLPTSHTIDMIGGLVARAQEQIRAGVAPLASTPELAVAVALVTGLLAVVLDLVLVALRAPLGAAVLIAALGAVPSIVVHGGSNPVWFLALAVTILLFLHVRFAPPGSAGPGAHPAAAPVRTRPFTTVVVGALAAVAALVVSPLLPLSAAGIDAGGGTTALSATLDLGQDLRRPAPTTALTLITDDGTAPYLRIATLSAFDGRQWQPDRPPTVPLAQGFGAVTAADGVAEHRAHTTIRTTGISGSWLPVPYQATAVHGVAGAWTAAPDNRTVVAANADAADQNYTIDTTELVPTLAQIRASTASGSDAPESLRALPKNLPPVIAEDAATVTGGATTDYDRLIALQTWFRAGFRYSLNTPVQDGFDGTNVQAIATFLDVREGYCVHFAGAFALMARSLGMPTRIVVGYLPGTSTDRRSDDGRVVFEVGTDELHSWPEVYFAGIGWVPFEPTATRGVPTVFTDPTDSGAGSGPTPAAGATPLPTSSSAAKDKNRPDIPDAGAAGSSARGLDPAPVLWTVAGVVIVLLIPAAVRRLLSVRRMSSARKGDALAAWAELRAILQDLGLPAPVSESPRSRGARLVRERGADPAAVEALVRAVERASYARPGEAAGSRGEATGTELVRALGSISAELRRRVSLRDRIAAVVAPRSLLGARLMPASAS